MIDEQPNPLSNGKIVATNYDARLYVKQDTKRGDASYVMSRSELCEFAKCPSRWRAGYKENQDGTDSTDWGQLIDCLLFEPERFKERFAIYPDTYPAPESKKKDAATIQKKWNNNADYCKEWCAKQGEKICFSGSDVDAAQRAIKQLQADEDIAWIIADADFQVYATADYIDDSTGIIVPVKALIDIVPKAAFTRSLLDLKTARNGSPYRWNKTVHESNYHVQAALFLDIYNTATGEHRDEFRHICQENYSPFQISKQLLADDFLMIGRQKYTQALKRYARCLKTGHWDSYDDIYRESLNGWSLIHPEPYMLDSAA